MSHAHLGEGCSNLTHIPAAKMSSENSRFGRGLGSGEGPGSPAEGPGPPAGTSLGVPRAEHPRTRRPGGGNAGINQRCHGRRIRARTRLNPRSIPRCSADSPGFGRAEVEGEQRAEERRKKKKKVPNPTCLCFAKPRRTRDVYLGFDPV